MHPASGTSRRGPTVSADPRHRRDSELLVGGAPAGTGDAGTPPRWRFDTAAADFVPLPPVADRGPLHLPPPTGYADASVERLHRRLDRIVAERDVGALAALLAADVLVSFGGRGGPGEFRERWSLGREPAASPVWPLLERLLRHPPDGKARGDGYAWATWPWYFARWPDDVDAYGYVFAAAHAVPVQERPRRDAPVVARLGHEGVAVRDVRAPDGWVAVRTPAGEDGFVERAHGIEPVIGHRLLLERRDGAWRIAALVAGD